MNNEIGNDAVTASELQVALTDSYPDSTCGAIPVTDHYDALEAYRAFDDGSLAAVPFALTAYVSHQQRQWV